ncbi:MAG: hypothetical protein KGI27_12935 [Thaumarchaeota archaeon]|nr:hypothetical protein [Nitrososphaerota archaeon]
MNDRDKYTAEAMIKWGNDFVEMLGKAAIDGDSENLALIKATWPEYWKTYEEKGRELEKEIKVKKK